MKQETEKMINEIITGYEKLPLNLQERINIFFFYNALNYKIEDDYITEKIEETYDLINEFLKYEA